MERKQYTKVKDHPLRNLTKDALSLSKNGKFISTLTDVDVTEVKEVLRSFRRSGELHISFFSYLLYCTARTLMKHRNMMHTRTFSGKLCRFNFINALSPMEIAVGEEKLLAPKFLRRLETKSAEEIHRELESFNAENVTDDPRIKFFIKLPKFIRLLYYKIIGKSPKMSADILGNVLIVNDGIVDGGWGVGIPFHTTGVFFGSSFKKVVKESDQFIEKNYLNIHVSTDHRIVDGAPLFRFTNDLRNTIRHEYKNLLGEKHEQRQT